MLVNKDTRQNLLIDIQANQRVQTASLVMMNAASLSATSGVTIQGAEVNNDGGFAPARGTSLVPSATRTTCYVPALSAVLISIT
jgi:hypothetical protein